MLLQTTICFVMSVLTSSVLSSSAPVTDELNCFWNRSAGYVELSSKTIYENVRGDVRNSKIPGLEGCSPFALWSIIRHGTRRASVPVNEGMKAAAALLPEILDAHEDHLGTLCDRDVEILKTWSWDEEKDKAWFLTEAGYNELYSIGRRFQEHFSNLITEYDPEKFYFRPTKEQRTRMSSIAFVKGLFGNDTSAAIDQARLPDDSIRSYKSCDRWIKEVRDNPETYTEENKYAESEDMLTVKAAVQNRTGIETELTVELITGIFELCRFEKAWKPNEISPWCVLLTPEDLAVLAYAEDLRFFYKNGYGNNMNLKLGAMVLQDLYEKLNNARTGTLKVVVYFSHDTMVEMMFAAMGLYKDDNLLKADNRDVNRKWNTAFISPFAVNMLATLYSCPENDFKVSFHVNETPQPVPGCRAGALCTWSEFQEKFQPFKDSSLDFCKL